MAKFGDHFKDKRGSSIYVLGLCMGSGTLMVALIDIVDGNRFRDAIEVEDAEQITDHELEEIGINEVMPVDINYKIKNFCKSL